MEQRNLTILLAAAALALVGAVSVGILVLGDEVKAQANGAMHKLHGQDHDGHGGHEEHAEAMKRIIEELDLSPEQLRHVERVGELLTAQHARGIEPIRKLHELLLEQLRLGHMDAAEIKRAVDEDLERMRQTAHDVTDELVALAKGLDATQREKLLRHLGD